MRKIGLIGNKLRDPNFAVTKRVVALLAAHRLQAVVDPESQDPELCSVAGLAFESYQNCELAISFGGDGSLLAAAHLLDPWNIPLVGVNLGSLGFMAEIEISNLEDDIARLASGEYRIEERMQLKIQLFDKENKCIAEGFALNDVLCSRMPFSRIVTYQLYLNGEMVENIPGDGIIFSTPTGSTGYAMAAGGPILDPKLDALLLTPICPHTLHNRSYVLEADSKVDIYIPHTNEVEAFVAWDGRENQPFLPGYHLAIQRSTRHFKLLTLHEQSFYTKVPEKIQKRSFAQ